MAEYEPWICDPFGVRLFPLAQYDLLSYARSDNALGKLEIKLPGDFDMRDVRKHGLIMVWRDGRLDTETAWIIVGKRQTTDRKGTSKVYLRAMSGNYLLTSRIVAYAKGTTQASKSGPADNIAKAYVRENLGTLATDTSRQLSTSLFSVAADVSMGPAVTHEGERQSLFRVCQDIARKAAETGTYFSFDTVYLPELNRWEFRTYTTARGVDKSSTTRSPVTFSSDFGNIGDDALDDDYEDEVTFVYAGGQGEEGARVVQTGEDTVRSTSSPYGRRERFITASTSDADKLADDALAAVREGRPRRTYTAGQEEQRRLDEEAQKAADEAYHFQVFQQHAVPTLGAAAQAAVPLGRGSRGYSGGMVQTGAFQYGRDWQFGDIVAVKAYGQTLDCRVSAVGVTVERGSETIKSTLVNTAALS